MDIIGRVGIKVWPDTRRFREEARRGLREATKGLKAEVPLHIDEVKMELAVRKAVRSLNSRVKSDPTMQVTIPGRVDMSRALRDIKDFVSHVEKTYKARPIELRAKIDVDKTLGDLNDTVRDKVKDVEKEVRDIDVKPRLHVDDDKLRRDIDKFMRDQNWSEVIKIDLDEAGLRDLRKRLDKMRDRIVLYTSLKFDESEWGRQVNAWRLEGLKGIDIAVRLSKRSAALVKAQLARVAHDLWLDVKTRLDQSSIWRSIKLAQIIAQKQVAKMRLKFDESALGRAMVPLKAALAKAGQFRLKPILDGATAEKIKAHLRGIKGAVRVKAEATKRSLVETKANIQATLKALGDVKVKVKAVLDKKSVQSIVKTFAALSGARVMSDVYDKLLSPLKSLDKKLPLISGLTIGIMQLVAAVAALSGNLLSLSNGVAQIIPGLLAMPGIFAGIAVGAVVAGVALADLNRRVPAFKKAFGEMKKSIRDNFWGEATKPMQHMADQLLPKIARGVDGIAVASGRYFGALANSLTKALAPRLEGMFKAVARGFDVMRKGTDPLANIVAVLGTLGEVYLPKLAQSFVNVTTRFSNFLSINEKNGNLFAWVDLAARRLKELWSVIVNLGGVLRTLAKAAELAGGSTLAGFAKALGDIRDTLREKGNFDALVRFFQSANEAMDELYRVAGPGVKEMFKAIGKTLTEVMPSAGRAVGTLVGHIAKALADPKLQGALANFVRAIEHVAQKVAPAFDSIGKGLSEIIGFLAGALESFAPLIVTAFDGVGQLLSGISGPLMLAVSYLASALNELLKIILPPLRDLFPKIAEKIAVVAKAVSDFINNNREPIATWINNIKRMIEAVLPLIDILVPLLLPALEGLVSDMALMSSFLATVIEWVSKAIQKMWEWFQIFITWWGPKLAWLQQKFAEFMTFIGLLVSGQWAQAWRVAKDLFSTMMGIVERQATQTMGWLKDAFNSGVGFVQGVWNAGWGAIKNVASTTLGAIRSTVGRVMSEIKGLIQNAWNGVLGGASASWGRIRDTIVSKAGEIKNGISAKFNEVVQFFQGLPGRITSAMGDLGGLLVGAGRSIISGLMRGIDEMTGSLFSKLNWITSRIPNEKGPPKKDATLLTNAGRLIMQSLINGMDDKMGDLRSFLNDLTDDIAGADLQATLGVKTSRVNGKRMRAALADDSMPSFGGTGPTFEFNITNPQAEPTSKTVDRAMQMVSILPTFT